MTLLTSSEFNKLSENYKKYICTAFKTLDNQCDTDRKTLGTLIEEV